MNFINNEILLKHGIISIRDSETNKKIAEFENNFKNINELYSEINNIPFLRFLLQIISKKEHL